MGKTISVLILVILFAWQCLIAYLLHDIVNSFKEFEPANYKVEFMTFVQPYIWVFMILTLGIIFDVFKRSKFLILNSILIIAIIAVSNGTLSFFIVMEAYEPIMNLGSK